jgi:hypothetical protein
MAEQSTSAEFLKPAVLSLAFGVFFCAVCKPATGARDVSHWA